MNILGINGFFEHPSIAILSDHNLLFAIEEERLTKIKGGRRFNPYNIYIPFKSIYSGLDYLDMRIEDIDVIAYSYSPSGHTLGFIRSLFKKHVLSSFRDDLSALLCLANFKRFLGSEYELFQHMSKRISNTHLSITPIRYFEHHLSHAASAYYCSGFENSLVVTADGSGETAGTSIYEAVGNKVQKIRDYKIPNSLGFMYSFVTKHLGFNPFQDEYKVMGLASYGEPRFEKEFKNIVNWDSEGNYRVDVNNLLNLTSILGPARDHGDHIEERHKDIAKSLQVTLEKILINLLRFFRKKSKSRNLCFAGGVALNCVANGKIAEMNLFDNIFIQPAADDAGTAIGAAGLINAKHNPQSYQLNYNDFYLGTSYSNQVIATYLKQAKIEHYQLDDQELIKLAANKIAEGKIGGVFRGRMEFGPRALGNRSIIASPGSADMHEKINNIKGRESFRPIAPLIKYEAFEDYFSGQKNEYMLFTCKTLPSVRSKIPAVIHVDGTARVQVVKQDSNKFIYNLICEFEKLTGIPLLVNTSLNFKGQPIVENPLDAIASFYTSGLDFFIIENYILEKIDKNS